MTNKEILEIALQQSAYDCNCTAADFLSEQNVVTISKANAKARKYVPLPLECDLVSYGNNIVAQVSERTKSAVSEYINKFDAYHCFETPQINMLNDLLAPFDLKVCFMAEYFLPDVTKLKELDCGYELRVLYKEDFADLYTEQWSNCFTFDDRERDVLAVGAYDNGKLTGLAGCSADCEMMVQIGVDVLPAYRRKGIASAVTSKLALEVLALGKVPFYCAAWSNIRSVRNAVKSGFRPAWVELTARECAFVQKLIT
ncbi:MAG: GNAT family N-acetyltransferase [Ruminococcus sp.]|jgi:GNAT superfamily N-acetyltransferase|nr:GNAT family N-acetyltransferase [Ruminococcus sp.]MBQ1380378.1 GNAT family N-acetyltransferase [Ruminococcus sp.]MBQ1944219.1 GNAT family N-acetyltransferase [Ruminococcus sp.]MBQ2358287.1 GNAT family N-acetyltransferase [Ruminococcus sp.]MBQ2474816.1 GNAT family N-acetyltransferase [Ruminococcus sp.]